MAPATIPAELPQSSVVAIVDTREQMRLDLAPLSTIVGIERKSLSDLIGCVGQERERFDREVRRLIAYPVRCLIVESTWPEIERGEWRGKVTPAAAIGSLLGWIAHGLPVVMTGNHERAGTYAARLLYTAARRRWREARAFLGQMAETIPEQDGELTPSA